MKKNIDVCFWIHSLGRSTINEAFWENPPVNRLSWERLSCYKFYLNILSEKGCRGLTSHTWECSMYYTPLLFLLFLFSPIKSSWKRKALFKGMVNLISMAQALIFLFFILTPSKPYNKVKRRKDLLFQGFHSSFFPSVAVTPASPYFAECYMSRY